LATLLFHSARTIDEWASDDGTRLAHRPYPSAGARHPIGITVVANEVDGLAAGAWDFDPVRCRLQPSDWRSESAARVVGAATAALGGVTPPALVVAVAEPDRTLSRYPAGTAHLWRDAGAMLTTVHLVATATGLQSSIVGIGGQIGDESEHAIDVGAVAVGR
jgi:SagB-type dehydrogenase family enzyme